MKTGANHEPALLYVIAWLVLVVLTGVSLGTAFLGLGRFAPISQFGIADPDGDHLHAVHAPQGPAVAEMGLRRRRLLLVIVSVWA